MGQLLSAIKPGNSGIISFIGGGGKTTAIYKLSQELTAIGKKNIITTTTKIWPPDPEKNIKVLTAQDYNHLTKSISLICKEYTRVCVGSDINEEGKLLGLEPEYLDHLNDASMTDYILCEADGAKGKPMKAPAAHEPVIPSSCGLVIGVIGWDALNQPLDDRFVQRAKLFSELTGYPLNLKIDLQVMADIFTHPKGIFKGSPPFARRMCMINKIDMKNDIAQARDLGTLLLQSGLEKVLLCSLKNSEPVWEVLQ